MKNITIIGVSDELARLIENVAANADAGCGPKIEIEITDPPKKYEALVIREFQEPGIFGNKDAMIILDEYECGNNVAAQSFDNSPECVILLRRLHHEHQIGMKGIAWMREHKLLVPKMGRSYLTERDAILDELDAGLKG